MKLFLFVACFLMYTVVLANNFDSLRQTLQGQYGAQRLPTLLKLCDSQYRGIIPNAEANGYGKEILHLASVRKDTSALVEACLCIANSQDRTAEGSDAFKWLRKAQSLARRYPALQTKVLFWKASYYYELGKLDSALLMIQGGDLMARRHQLFSERVKLLGTAAKIYSSNGQAQAADSSVRLAFRFCQNRADSAIAYTRWGSVQEDLGKLDLALPAFYTAYRLEKKEGNKIMAAYNLQQCAGILRDQGHYQQAIKYLQEAVQLSKAIGNLTGLAAAYHTLGGLYKRTRDYEAALKSYQLSLSLKKDIGRPKKILNTIIDMSILYGYTARYDSCLHLCRQYLALSQQIEYKLAEATLTLWGSIAAEKTGNSALAQNYWSVGEKALARVKAKEEMPELFLFAAKAAETARDFGKAYQYQTLFQSAQDSIYNTEKSRIIAELEAQFENEKKEQEILVLAKENELSRVRIATARTRQLALLGGIALIALLALVLWRNAQRGKQQNQLLEKMNSTLSHKNDEVQTLLREIHHRVKNNLQIVSSLLRLQARGLDDKGAQDALRISQSRVQSIALLHQRLYQGQELKDIPIRPYIEELTLSLSDAYRLDERQISIHTEVEEFSLDVDTAMPIGLILTELIINAIKHAFVDGRKGEIRLNLQKNDVEFRLLVADNGLGLKLSEGKPVHSMSSFGLELVASLAQKLNARLVFSNGQGTSTELIVPLLQKRESSLL